jgi:uncharacterized protein (TIGR02145 family)
MNKLLTIFLLLVVFVCSAQRKFFHANNYFVTQPLPPSMVTNGLVLNLDAGNTSSYLGSGTTWTDLTASGNNGTLTNGPVFNTRNGGSILFDGLDDVVGFGNILTIGLNSWTMSCWVKFDGGAGIMGIMGKTSYRAYDGRYSFYIENNNINAFFKPFANNIISTPVAPYLDNKFHNLVMTISRSSMMYFYIDGISVGTPIDVSSTSAINLNSTDKFYIGSYGSTDGQSPLYYFKGSIGQALIYNRALSAAEVTTNFNVIKARYDDITIGSQVWTSKNLDVSTYRNGDAIPQVTDPTVWASLTTGAWCYHNNDPSTAAIYGKMYNWYAVNDSRGLAPQGYHIPTDAEWTTLSNSLGGDNISGGKMKTTGTTNWGSPNTGATNSSGFSGLPGGYGGESFGSFGSYGSWWTATESAALTAYTRDLGYNYTYLYVASNRSKRSGFSVRCVKD